MTIRWFFLLIYEGICVIIFVRNEIPDRNLSGWNSRIYRIGCWFMELRYVNGRGFVRYSPQVKSLVMQSVAYGDIVEVTGNVSGQFSEILMGDTLGWVHTENILSVPMRKHPIVIEDGYPNFPAGNMLDLANMYLSYLPESFLTNIYNLGWRIVITARDLDMYFYKGKYDGVAGVVDYANKIVYLQDTRLDIMEAIYHELGHVCDYLAGLVSDSKEFLEIFTREKDQFNDSTSVGDGHETSCPREYFASVFSEMLRNPSKCKSEIPESYAFVEKIVNNFA